MTKKNFIEKTVEELRNEFVGNEYDAFDFYDYVKDTLEYELIMMVEHLSGKTCDGEEICYYDAERDFRVCINDFSDIGELVVYKDGDTITDITFEEG